MCWGRRGGEGGVIYPQEEDEPKIRTWPRHQSHVQLSDPKSRVRWTLPPSLKFDRILGKLGSAFSRTHPPRPLLSPQPSKNTAMSTTESLHKQCRTLESLFDNKLTAYSRLAATITRPGSHDLESTGSLERWQDLEVELEELLQKVGTSSVRAIWLLTIPGGCSWERSTTNLIRCRAMRAIK